MYLKILNEESNPLSFTITNKLYIKPFRDQCNNISNQINLFEQQIGFTLPDDYKKFLLKYNGGECYPFRNGDYYVKPIESLNISYDAIVIYFYGFANDQYTDLRAHVNDSIEMENMDIKSNNINGMKTIRIAGADGNFFQITEDHKIYYWDHECPWLPETEYILYANSFTQFIQNGYYKFKSEIDMREYFATPGLEEVII